MRETAETLPRLVAATPPGALTTPEAPGKWSIRDVVQHLADSELVGGFRLRLVLASIEDETSDDAFRVAVQYTGIVGAHGHGINW